VSTAGLYQHVSALLVLQLIFQQDDLFFQFFILLFEIVALKVDGGLLFTFALKLIVDMAHSAALGHNFHEI